MTDASNRCVALVTEASRGVGKFGALALEPAAVRRRHHGADDQRRGGTAPTVIFESGRHRSSIAGSLETAAAEIETWVAPA